MLDRGDGPTDAADAGRLHRFVTAALAGEHAITTIIAGAEPLPLPEGSAARVRVVGLGADDDLGAGPQPEPELGDGARLCLVALAAYRLPVPAVAVMFLLRDLLAPDAVAASLDALVRGGLVRTDLGSGRYRLRTAGRCLVAEVGGLASPLTRTTCHLRAAELFARLRRPDAEWHVLADLVPTVRELGHRLAAGDVERADELARELDAPLTAAGQLGLLIGLRSELAAQLDDPDAAEHNAGALGVACRRYGELADAAVWLERACERARRNAGPRLADWLDELGLLRVLEGEPLAAVGLHQEALRVRWRTRDGDGQSRTYARLGDAHRRLDQLDTARACYRRALDKAREHDDESALERFEHRIAGLSEDR